MKPLWITKNLVRCINLAGRHVITNQQLKPFVPCFGQENLLQGRVDFIPLFALRLVKSVFQSEAIWDKFFFAQKSAQVLPEMWLAGADSNMLTAPGFIHSVVRVFNQ